MFKLEYFTQTLFIHYSLETETKVQFLPSVLLFSFVMRSLSIYFNRNMSYVLLV